MVHHCQIARSFFSVEGGRSADNVLQGLSSASIKGPNKHSSWFFNDTVISACMGLAAGCVVCKARRPLRDPFWVELARKAYDLHSMAVWSFCNKLYSESALTLMIKLMLKGYT